MAFEQFADDYGDFTSDVINAGYETYETKLSDWFDFIEQSPVSKDRVEKLQSGFDFPTWYEAARSTMGSMVGSGKVSWAKDRTERLGQQLALFKHFATEEFAWSDFSSNFLWAGSRFDDNIEKINSDVFAPFARELLKDIERNRATEAVASDVPAADRIVALDHNSRGYTETVDSLGQVLDTVQRSNEIGAEEPDTRERVVAELDAGKRLLKATQVRAQAVWAVVYPALRWIAGQAGGTILGVAITAAIALLATLLGITVPGL
jgi:hypothetical protein